jgi:hypothetical protein
MSARGVVEDLVEEPEAPRRAKRCPAHGAYSVAVDECPRCRIARQEGEARAELLEFFSSEGEKMSEKRCPKHGPGEHIRRNGCRKCRSEAAVAKGGAAVRCEKRPPGADLIAALRTKREELAAKVDVLDRAIEALTG